MFNFTEEWEARMSIDKLKNCLLACVCVLWQLPMFSMQAIYIVDGVRFKLYKGDITRHPVDVIVNAANSHLLGGSGVDGAIHEAAGPELLKYNMKIPASLIGDEEVRCPVGQVVVTPSFNLKDNGIAYIIHAHGPHGSTPKRAGMLSQCYQQAIEVANGLKIYGDPVRSIAFPAISVGIFGYPKQEATFIAVGSVMEIIHQLKVQGSLNLNEVCFMLYDQNPDVEELCALYVKACNYFADRIEMRQRESQGLDKVKAVMKNICISTWQKGALVWRKAISFISKPVSCGISYLSVATRVLMPWLFRR
jgi:O-acetyl-ADP-ribose deacetylase (regulator of RNase III)